MIGRFRALLAAAVALFGLVAPAAKADFIYDLTVADWGGSGNITFSALSGSSTAGVTAFAFHVSSGFGSPQDYGLADLSTVEWSIDSAFNLALQLTTNAIPFDSIYSAIVLNNVPGASVFGQCAAALPGSSTTCTSNVTQIGAVLTPRFVGIEVPEPATLALFGGGLVGLGMVARRRKAA